MRSRSLFCLVSFLTIPTCRADDAINPERPGFTNGAAVVGARTLQLEEGVTRYSGAGGYRLGDGGIVRVGLDQKTELRVGLPSWRRGDGFARAAYGIKAQVLPQLAGIVQCTVEGHPTTQAALEAEFPLTEKLTLQADLVRDAAWSSGLNLGFALTERIGLFVETYHAQGAHLDGGVTYQLTPDRQIDLSAGDQFVRVGFAWRLRR